jgi:hypothetical protein
MSLLETRSRRHMELINKIEKLVEIIKRRVNDRSLS